MDDDDDDDDDDRDDDDYDDDDDDDEIYNDFAAVPYTFTMQILMMTRVRMMKKKIKPEISLLVIIKVYPP